MKTVIIALMLSITALGFAQAPKSIDPTYIGVVHHKSHKLRSVLIGAGVAAGIVAVVVLTHSSQAAPLPVHNFPAPFIPTVAVQK